MIVPINGDLRCKKCGKKLGSELQGRVAIVCPKCSVYNIFDTGYTSHKLTALDKRQVVL